jgi:chromosome segregation ATPase
MFSKKEKPRGKNVSIKNEEMKRGTQTQEPVSAIGTDGKSGRKDKVKDSANPMNTYKNELEKIQDYDAGFKSIFEATQINDIDTLIEEFQKAENNNYSLLTYAESLSSEIKELDDEIKSVENEIAKYSEDGEELENNRDKQFKRINDELEKTEKETKEYERQYQETVKTINQLKIGIKSIFDRIG